VKWIQTVWPWEIHLTRFHPVFLRITGDIHRIYWGYSPEVGSTVPSSICSIFTRGGGTGGDIDTSSSIHSTDRSLYSSIHIQKVGKRPRPHDRYNINTSFPPCSSSRYPTHQLLPFAPSSNAQVVAIVLYMSQPLSILLPYNRAGSSGIKCCEFHRPSYLTSSWAIDRLSLECSDGIEGTDVSIARYSSRRFMLIALPIRPAARYICSAEVKSKMIDRMAECMKKAPVRGILK
jgi:hypothetical protein